MGATRRIQMLVLALALIAGLAERAPAATLPPEPSDEYLVDEEVNIVAGLYLRAYSLARDGIVDFRTARQILRSEFNEYWNTVVETQAHPLFYWYEADHTGAFEMWIDRNVEGCTCDIVPYQAVSE